MGMDQRRGVLLQQMGTGGTQLQCCSVDNDERGEHYLESGIGEGWNSAPGYMLHPFICEFDAYGIIDINGEYQGTFSDYFKAWPIGTTYEIRNIRPVEGKEYAGCYQESVVGQVKSLDTNVFLAFKQSKRLIFAPLRRQEHIMDMCTCCLTHLPHGMPQRQSVNILARIW